MTDDDRLAKLFRDAAADPAPPPGFDRGDVLAASRRITTRRRSVVMGGAVALFAVVGVGVVIGAPGGSQGASSAAPAASAAAESAPGDAALQAQPVPERQAGASAALPDGTPRAGEVPGAAASEGAPPGGAGDCALPDPGLRVLVEQVLPEVAGAPGVPPEVVGSIWPGPARAGVSTAGDACRPGGQRRLALQVQDRGIRGVLVVDYLPPGVAASPPPGAVSAPTASGGTVVVGSGPVGGTVPPPFASRLDDLAGHLAARL